MRFFKKITEHYKRQYDMDDDRDLMTKITHGINAHIDHALLAAFIIGCIFVVLKVILES